ncbi:hypothetical protein ECEC1865_5953, partial [Escherichia coli EC1865]
FYRLVPS